MTIRIERNDAGNCIHLHGAPRAAYQNTVLSAEEGSLANTVNIINDDLTAEAGTDIYEMFQVAYTELTGLRRLLSCVILLFSGAN